MKRYLKTAVAALLPVLVAAGCNDFLKCSECVTDPNAPTQSTINQRFVSVEANMWQYQNGDLARLIAMWMQSMAGTDRQYQALGVYQITESGEDGEFQRPYTGGGLIDLHYIENAATTTGDKVYLGVAQVMEAWMIGTTADIWGDIPYSQAAQPDSFSTPQFDPQQQVYDSIQTLLSAAIANLGSGQGSGPGPVDLAYNGDPAKWVALAHTLKARYYMHTAEKDPTAYASALAEANQGISSNAGDYVTLQTKTPYEDNNWYQFMVIQRSGYISAGSYLVNLLKSTNDPRLDEYYAPGDTSEIIGADPGESISSAIGTLSNLRLAEDYPQALVTYNENELIKAEAQYQTGDEPGALASLNAELASWASPTWGGARAWHTDATLTPSAAAGTALLTAIMTEKYIALFQNIEVWNDYKRTCIPALTPALGKTEIPARLLYGTTERQTNPNTPPNPVRNWNDPNGCGG